MVVVALNPALAPCAVVSTPPCVTWKVAGFVTSRMVRFPVNSYLLFPRDFMEVLWNVILGYFSALKNSSDFRWPSLLSLSVLMEATSIVKFTLASEKSGLLCSREPSNIRKLPSISDTTMCVMVNFTLECPLSSVHLVPCANAPAVISNAKIENEMTFFIRVIYG